MTVIPLAVPYLDTGADQLAFALGLPEQPALATAEVPLGGGHTAILRLLGASHQVICGPIRETVACLPGQSGPLPAALRERIGGWDYAFASRTERHEPPAFADHVARIRAALRDRDGVLCGAFPGLPDALTALAPPRDGGPGWDTWHTYPQTCDIVTTRTRLEVP